jgi:nucleoside-diphosphate-sugar epimerase
MTAPQEYLLEHARRTTEDPQHGATEAWSYLDVRDAARAVELSLLSDAPGAHPVFVAADTTCVPYPTEDLLDRYAAGAQRLRRFVDRETPIDLTVARTLLGFQAVHLLPIDPRPMPAPDGAAVSASGS